MNELPIIGKEEQSGHCRHPTVQRPVLPRVSRGRQQGIDARVVHRGFVRAFIIGRLVQQQIG